MNEEDLPLIFCAADTPDLPRAEALANAMEKAECGLKLGLEFFNAQGPQGVRHLQKTYAKLPIFLDLKFHDISNTVAGAVRSVAPLAPAYLNVHASGGVEMMKAARDTAVEEATRLGLKPPRLLGVTILTSLNDSQLEQVGFQPPAKERVVQLALLVKEAGLDGIVCSPQEIESVRAACGDDFVLMVPGIRPAGADKGDQKRVMTPPEAVAAGATHLVIGRPITGAADPGQAAAEILADLMPVHKRSGTEK